MNEKKAAAFRLGVMVLLALAVLTAVEYAVSFMEVATVALFVIAIMKAGAILEYFMHISSLWSEEGGH